ncbi:MAG: tRNA lysidine(34) synthetase TilS [Bacteroidales bacterium]|nr:tRNA lysidine(34) synthetase TilS [Bacteroidales bacterium]
MKRILLAVSGGMDSMYLCERASELFPGASFAVAHCNFGLRGAESDADEAFVRDWCLRKGVPLFVQRFDTRSYAREQGLSIEMAARALRYGWFSRLCAEEGFDALAVAHHADDNAETLLLNLLRGTGLRGLQGMSSARKLEGCTVLRPLLGVSREEIAAWMQGHGLAWREDSSNASDAYARNRIRHEVMPVLKELNPSVLDTFEENRSRIREQLRVADDWYEEEFLRLSGMEGASAGRIPAREVAALRYPRLFLQRWTEPVSPASATLERLLTLLENGKTFSGKVFEGRSGQIRTDRGFLVLQKETQSPSAKPQLLSGPGVFSTGKGKLSIELHPRTQDLNIKLPEGQLIADAGQLVFPLLLRPWRAGDWLRPLGLCGRKKISDLFTDLHWSAERKSSACVLCACDAEGREAEPGHVLALLPVRIDDSVRVRPDTGNVLFLNYSDLV